MHPKAASVLFGLASLLVVTGAAAGAQPGRIYKWVDDKGVTHYGQAIPLEYRDQGMAEMNQGGLTVRKIDPAATAEQRKAAEDKARRERDEQKKLFEQRRRDTALLNTYTSTREIDEARERNLALPSQTIRGLQPRLKRAEERLAALQGRADGLQKAGKPVPESLKEDMAEAKLDLDGVRADIDRNQAQIEAIRTRFEQDKQRYLELTASR
jgi:chromosome segregation ATPase